MNAESKQFEKEFNKVFANRLNYYLQEFKMTQKSLADKLNVGTSTVSNWAKGLKSPRMDKVDAMCEIFGCSRSDLVEMPKDNKEVKTISIPVFTYVSAGNGVYADSNIERYVAVPSSLIRNDEYFGLRVRGDSMLPEIRNNDVVIVKKQDTAEDGDTVIALVNGDEGYCKKFVTFGKGISLVSHNPAYNPMIFTYDQVESTPVKILGVVKQLIREM